MMIGRMIQTAIAGGQNRDITKIWEMLIGTHEIEEKEMDPQTAKQLVKAAFGLI